MQAQNAIAEMHNSTTMEVNLNLNFELYLTYVYYYKIACPRY